MSNLALNVEHIICRSVYFVQTKIYLQASNRIWLSHEQWTWVVLSSWNKQIESNEKMLFSLLKQGLHKRFQQEGNLFLQAGKTFWTELFLYKQLICKVV